jgi:hypothetical protein
LGRASASPALGSLLLLRTVPHRSPKQQPSLRRNRLLTGKIPSRLRAWVKGPWRLGSRAWSGQVLSLPPFPGPQSAAFTEKTPQRAKDTFLTAQGQVAVGVGIGTDRFVVDDDVRDEIRVHTHAQSDRGSDRRRCFRPVASDDGGKGVRAVSRRATDEVLSPTKCRSEHSSSSAFSVSGFCSSNAFQFRQASVPMSTASQSDTGPCVVLSPNASNRLAGR